MENRISEGDLVKHFKRETLSVEEYYNFVYMYKVIAIGRHTETGEKMVVYKALYNSEKLGVKEGQVFIRPFDMFMGKVDKEKYPNIKQEYRFERM